MGSLARSAPGGTRDPPNGAQVRIRAPVTDGITPAVLSVLFHQFIGPSSCVEGWLPVVAVVAAAIHPAPLLAGSISGSSTATSNRTQQHFALHQP